MKNLEQIRRSAKDKASRIEGEPRKPEEYGAQPDPTSDRTDSSPPAEPREGGVQIPSEVPQDTYTHLANLDYALRAGLGVDQREGVDVEFAEGDDLKIAARYMDPLAKKLQGGALTAGQAAGIGAVTLLIGVLRDADLDQLMSMFTGGSPEGDADSRDEVESPMMDADDFEGGS